MKSGDSRNNRLAKVVVVANSKQKVFSWTHNVVKHKPKILVWTIHFTGLHIANSSAKVSFNLFQS